MIRPTFIDLNPFELKFYPFMISLDKCTASHNVLSPKIWVVNKTNSLNVKAFNMITNIIIQIKNETIKHVNVSVKIIVHVKKL